MFIFLARWVPFSSVSHDLFTFFSRKFLTGPQTFFVKSERPKIEKLDKFLRVITVDEGYGPFGLDLPNERF